VLSPSADPERLEAGRHAAGDGRDEPAAGRELALERVERAARGRGRDVDRVERRLLRQPARAVAHDERDVADARALQRLGRAERQVRVALDRPHVAHQEREDRRVIAGAGPHVEHPVPRMQVEELRHARDDERLGDRLTAADPERRVVVGVLAQVGGDERLPRNAGDRVQHAVVGDVLAQFGDEAVRLAHRITA